MYKLSEKIEFLKRCHLFESLSFDELKVITLTSSEVIAKAGEILFREGEEALDAYVIFEGEVEAFKDQGNGGKITLVTLRAYDIFGEFAIISRCPRTAGILVTKDFRGLRITRDSFMEIVRHFPDVSIRIMETLVKRILGIQEKYLKLLDEKNGNEKNG